MINYIFKRVLLVIPVMIGVSFLVFTMIHFTPGDPAAIMLGETATAESIAQLREELGLNDPFLVQYFRYVRNIVVDQDFGRSYVTNRPVINDIAIRFPNTLRLALLGVIVSVSIGVPLGIISAVKQYSLVDNLAMFFAGKGKERIGAGVSSLAHGGKWRIRGAERIVDTKCSVAETRRKNRHYYVSLLRRPIGKTFFQNRQFRRGTSKRFLWKCYCALDAHPFQSNSSFRKNLLS